MAIFNSYVSLPEGKSLKLAPFGCAVPLSRDMAIFWMRSQRMWYHVVPYTSPMHQVPSGKRLHNYGKPPFFMDKSTISMAIFHSYVSLPEGIPILPIKSQNFPIPPVVPFPNTQAFPNVADRAVRVFRGAQDELKVLIDRKLAFDHILTAPDFGQLWWGCTDLWKNSLWLKQHIRHITYNIYNIQYNIYI